eukprot:TRINITY_DN422_c0_g1_i1.p1 TRINITY_DN422_c0_g1~~TRINITY_DN422_c0_g1_i1.p1  ORF type:complete len:554 (+),score=142.11 TRINITY_DN422_c0_g1_i1:233-1894(+)
MAGRSVSDSDVDIVGHGRENHVRDSRHKVHDLGFRVIRPTDGDLDGLDINEDSLMIKGIQEWQRIETKGMIPSARCWFGACVVVNNLYVFGGYNGKKYNAFLRDLHCLDLETMEWKELATKGEVPNVRYAHSFTAVDNHRIFMFGGAAGKHYYNSLHILDTDTLVWSKPTIAGIPPLERCAHATAFIHPYLYVHGGDHGMGLYLDDMSLLHTESLTWTVPCTTNPKPPPRGWHSVSTVGDKLYFFGGCNESRKHSLFNDVWILHTTTMEWENPKLKNKTPARYSHTSVAVGTDMVVIGGKYKDGGYADVNWLDTELAAWWQPSIEGSQPSNRFAHCTFFHKGRVYVFGGFNGTNTFNDMHALVVNPERRSSSLKAPTPELGFDLKRLVNSKHFSDVQFIVEGETVYAHRNILASRSSYFNIMFLSRMQMKETNSTEIEIKDVSYQSFIMLMNYMYAECLDLDVNAALDLLQLANLYQYDKLKADLSYVIERYMVVDNCCALHQHAHYNNADELKRVCMEFIMKNYEVVKNTFGFRELPTDLVAEIMDRADSDL